MLLKTDTSKRHSHAVFMRDDGSGYTSIDAGHWHPVIPTYEFESWKPDRKKAEKEFYSKSAEDAELNADIAEKDDNSRFFLSKVTKINDHSHELLGFSIKEESESDDLSDDEKVKRVYDFLKEARACESEAIKQGISARDFARGKQWDTATKNLLEGKRCAAHTLNYTKRMLTYLSGLFRQNKTDIQTLPEEESDSVTSDILNAALRRIQHQTKMNRGEIQAFEDLSCTGRGALLVDVDTSWNPLGDISVKYYPWKDFSVSPHIMSDGSDAEYVVMHPFVSLNELLAKYPEKAEDLEADWADIENLMFMESKHDHIQHASHHYMKSSGQSGVAPRHFSVTDKEFVDVTRKQILLLHMMERDYSNRRVAVNPVENEYADVTNLSIKDIEQIKKLEGFSLVNDCKHKIKLITVAGNTILEEKTSIFDDFNLVFGYANKSEDFFWGIVEDIKDSQLELNKWSSKLSDILNKADAWHLGVSPAAFATEADHREYLENASTPGYQPKFAEGFQNHIKEYSNSNAGIIRDLVPAIQQAINQMSQITNIYESTMGQTSSAESGVALAQKTRASLTGNEYIFDNFSAMKEKVGRLIIQGIQKTWSPERILRLVESQTTREDIMIGGDSLYPEAGPEELLQFGVNTGKLDQNTAGQLVQLLKGDQQKQQQPTPEMQQQLQGILQELQEEYRKFRREKLLLIIENRDLTRLDVSVVENTSSPTTMMSNFMVLSELARTRPDIPVDALLDTWPFLGSELRTKIMGSIQAARQAQAEEQQLKSKTEIQKTLISAQSKQQSGPEGAQARPVAGG